MSKVKGSVSDAAMMCFRKKLAPVTEENLKLDSVLVFEMLDRKIRVQDLLGYLNLDINDADKAADIRRLVDWQARRVLDASKTD